MPRNGTTGLYSTPAGTNAVPGAVISAAPYNSFLSDLKTVLNTPQPVIMGGTGATTAAGARTNLGILGSELTASNVATIDDLRNLDPDFTSIFCNVVSYLDPADYPDGRPHGGGAFWYDPDDASTSDDDVFTFVDAASRRWKRIVPGFVPISAFGVVGDRTTDDTTAWNRMITAVNAGLIRSVYLDPGFDILLDGPSTWIYVSDVRIWSDGPDAARLTMKSSAGTAATFFKVGAYAIPFDAKTAAFEIGQTVTGGTSTASGTIVGMQDMGTWGILYFATISGTFDDNETITSATGSATTDTSTPPGKMSNLVLQGFGIVNLNSATLTTGAWQIEAYNCADLKIRDMYFQGAPWLRVGDGTQQPNRINVMDTNVIAYKGLGEAALYLQRSSGGLFQNVRLFASSEAADTAFRFIKIAPSSGSNIDTVTFDNVVANEGENDHDVTLEIDYSVIDVGTLTFRRCNFEQGLKAVYIHNTSAATGFARRINFIDCRLNPRLSTSGSAGLHVKNTNSTVVEVHCLRCYIAAGNGDAVLLEGDATDTGEQSVVIESCTIADRRAGVGGSRTAMTVGMSGFDLIGCKFIADNPSSSASLVTSSTFTSAVTFSAAVERFTIRNNNFLAITATKAIDASLLSTAHSPLKQIVKDNIYSKPQFPFYITTSTAGALQTIKTIPLEDESMYIITAIVGIKRGSSNNRAGYKLEGVFYRDGAGSATQESATATPLSAESSAAFDAAFAVSGNNVLIQGQIDSAVTTEIGCEVEVRAIL